ASPMPNTGGMNRPGDTSGYGAPGTTATGGGMGTGSGSTPNSGSMSNSNSYNPSQPMQNGTMQNGH
ncbi:MAG: hypothetical protein WCA85_13100, partial [Paraburkholderia sp.]